MTAQQPAEVAFDLEYDGPALAKHEMDARDFAAALVSAAELFQTLNRELNPLAPDLAVNIRATAPRSFVVQLRLAYASAKRVLLGSDATSAATLSTLLSVGGDLFRFVKHLRRRKVLKAEPATEAGLLRIVFDDSTTIEMPRQVPDVKGSPYHGAEVGQEPIAEIPPAQFVKSASVVPRRSPRPR